MFEFNSYSTPSETGKYRRMKRIFPGGKGIIVPLDDNLITGTDNDAYDYEKKLLQIANVKPNAVLAFAGTLSLLSGINPDISAILNLTASTNHSTHTNKILVSTIEKAIAFGADAIAVHINISSKYESDMLKNIGFISEKCDVFGMPFMVIVYPRREYYSKGAWLDDNYSRTKQDAQQKYTKLVEHCVRIAFELGADIIKTQYTGSSDSFEKVVKASFGKKILIAGGAMRTDEEFLNMVKGAIEAGASGVSIGRNVFGRKNCDKVILAVREIVFNNVSVKKALELFD